MSEKITSRGNGLGKSLRFVLVNLTPSMTKEPGLPPRVSIAVGGTVSVETKLNVVGCNACEIEVFCDDQYVTLQGVAKKLPLGAGNHRRKDAWTFRAERPNEGTEIRVTAKSDAGFKAIPVLVEVLP